MTWTLGIVDYVYYATESIEEITLKLKNEKDGKSTGEVVVGVSGLRPGQTDNSSTNGPQVQQQQQNEPTTGDLLGLDGDSTGPSISVVPDSTSTGGGGSPTPAATSSQQQQTANSPNRTSLLTTAEAVATAGAVTSGSTSTSSSTGECYSVI